MRDQLTELAIGVEARIAEAEAEKHRLVAIGGRVAALGGRSIFAAGIHATHLNKVPTAKPSDGCESKLNDAATVLGRHKRSMDARVCLDAEVRPGHREIRSLLRLRGPCVSAMSGA